MVEQPLPPAGVLFGVLGGRRLALRHRQLRDQRLQRAEAQHHGLDVDLAGAVEFFDVHRQRLAGRQRLGVVETRQGLVRGLQQAACGLGVAGEHQALAGQRGQGFRFVDQPQTLPALAHIGQSLPVAGAGRFDAVLGFAYFLKRPVAALGFPVQFTAQVADLALAGPAVLLQHPPLLPAPPAGGGQSGEDNKHDKQRPEAQALLAVKSAVRHGVSLLLLPPAADDPGRSLEKLVAEWVNDKETDRRRPTSYGHTFAPEGPVKTAARPPACRCHGRWRPPPAAPDAARPRRRPPARRRRSPWHRRAPARPSPASPRRW